MPSFCLGTPQVRNSFGHLSSFKTGGLGLADAIEIPGYIYGEHDLC